MKMIKFFMNRLHDCLALKKNCQRKIKFEVGEIGLCILGKFGFLFTQIDIYLFYLTVKIAGPETYRDMTGEKIIDAQIDLNPDIFS